MKRKIQFRGYNLKNKKWLYGYYLVNRGKSYIVQDEVVDPFAVPEDFEVDPESVGQFVGTSDGVDMYEGDNVECTIHTESSDWVGSSGILKWYEFRSRFVMARNNKCVEDFMLRLNYSFKVIGNEYEEKMKCSEQSV